MLDLESKEFIMLGKCKFVFDNNVKGDVLVTKEGTDSYRQYVFAGVFEIDSRSFCKNGNEGKNYIRIYTHK